MGKPIEIPDKDRLGGAFDLTGKDTKDVKYWAAKFVDVGIDGVLRSSLKKDFTKLSLHDRLASTILAYRISLLKDDSGRAAELAGGIFYYLADLADTEPKYTEDAFNFCKIIAIHGYTEMWIALIAAAAERYLMRQSDTGLKIIESVRKEGEEQLKFEYDTVFIRQYERQKALNSTKGGTLQLLARVFFNLTMAILAGGATVIVLKVVVPIIQKLFQ